MKLVDSASISKMVVFMCSLFCTYAYASPQEVLCLVDKNDAPFVFQDQGEYIGYAVDLMSSVEIKTGIKCKYQEVKGGISEQINLMSSGAGDIALGSITVTANREKNVDFSHSYFNSEIGAIYKSKGSSTAGTIKSIVKGFVKDGAILVVVLVAGFYLIGLLAHLCDRKTGINDLHNGAWWALVTFATVGYGDIVPKTGLGKIFAGVWILLSMSLLAVYTGYVSSVFVVDKINNDVKFGDLYQKRVVSISGTTSETLLNNSKIKAQYVDSIPSALELLKQDKVDTIVYDRPMLEYISKTNPDINLSVCGLEVGQEQYGFVLKQGSELRDKINIAILETLNSQEWKVISSKYF